MEYIIAGIRIAVPQEFTAGSFGTALAPFAAADEGPADLSVETRGEIRQADGYRELDEFDFADADADCRFGRDSEGYLLTMTPRDGCAAAVSARRSAHRSSRPTSHCGTTRRCSASDYGRCSTSPPWRGRP